MAGDWRTRGSRNPRRVWLLACLLAGTGAAAGAPAPLPTGRNLLELGFQDLMQIDVTSVLKSPQKAASAPAALFVIRQEDIRRSGATCIPEVLRMVPGVSVARLDANKWIVASRFASRRFSNTLLVLIDGRSVYSPLQGGVYWDQQDTMLEDVDRIEVIRGAGATTWGSNAVTGVINIVTKHARETQGGLAVGGAGREEKRLGALRYGGRWGEKGHYRVFAKYNDRDALARGNGSPGNDAWDVRRGGFRTDFELSSRDSLSVQGDFYDGQADNLAALFSLSPPFTRLDSSSIDFSGLSSRARWNRKDSDSSDFTVQLYFDRTDRLENGFREKRDTFDLEFDRRQKLGSRHDLVWGLGYRMSADAIDQSNEALFRVAPRFRDAGIASAFLQDTYKVRPDRLSLTAGARIEDNDFSGFNTQPSLRALWTPHADHTWWASVSRAERAASRLSQDNRTTAGVTPPGRRLTLPGRIATVPILTQVATTRGFKSEKVVDYELGYRRQISKQLSLDASGFHQRFHDFVRIAPGSLGPLQTTPVPHQIEPLVVSGADTALARGLELFANWDASVRWKLGLGYSKYDIDSAATRTEGTSPQDQIQVRSYLDLAKNLQLDTFVYRQSARQAFKVPSYWRLDMRLGWRPSPSLDIDLVGQNLLDDRHPEALSLVTAQDALGIHEAERGVYGKLTWHF